MRRLARPLLHTTVLLGVVCGLIMPARALAQSAQWQAALQGGNEALEQQDVPRAERRYTESLQQAETAKEIEQTILSLHRVASSYADRRHFADAERVLRRALVATELVDKADAITATTVERLAYILSEEGKHPERMALLERFAASMKTSAIGGRPWLEFDRNTFKAVEQQKKPKVPQLVWNVWPESRAAQTRPLFEPMPYLRPDTTYLIVVDLASLAYQGVASRVADEFFHGQVAQWIVDPKRPVSLDVYLLPDGDRFDVPQPRHAKLVVNTDKITRLGQEAHTLSDSPMAILKSNPMAPFVFGRLVFELTTRNQPGWAPVALSVWDQARPLDEIVVEFCIAPENSAATVCRDSSSTQAGLKGIDSLGGGLTTEGIPAAALHFFALKPDGPVVALFRRNGRGQTPIVWRLNKRASEFYPYLARTQLRVYNSARTADFAQHGAELYNTLFPVHEEAARRAFEAFVREHEGDAVPPALFVRMVKPDESPPLLMPLNLVFVANEFLGFRFRIETPLQLQRYGMASACITRWILVVPPEEADEPLTQARRHLGSFAAWAENAYKLVDTRMLAFGTWLLDRSGGVEDRSGLVVVSHHADNLLSFAEDDAISPGAVARDFARPSFAILNGCGTAVPGTVDFLGAFNRAGVETLIATATQVEGAMAGQFLDCFASVLASDSPNVGGPSPTIGEAYFKTLQCLKDRKSPRAAERYGPRALGYTLLGNTALPVCPPR